MKKIRITILLSALVGILLLWAVNPALLQDWIYASIGKPAQTYLMEMAAQQRPVGEALPGNMTVVELRERVDTMYQLKPDRRFIQAAEYIRHIVSAKPSPPVELAWVEDEWQFKIESKVIGALPAYASFEQGLSLLQSWAGDLMKSRGLSVTPATGNSRRVYAGGDGFNPTILIERLGELNSRWDPLIRGGETIHDASTYLTRLALINRDFIQLGDLHNSRAIGVLTLAILMNPDLDYDEQKSQLAYATGYTADAERFAANLSEDNLWRGFISEDDALLKNHLSESDAENEARYYWLLRLAQQGNSNQWLAHFNRYYLQERIPVHALLTGYELGQANWYSYLSHTIPLVMVEMTGGARVWGRLADEVIRLLPPDQRKLAKPVVDALKSILQPRLKTVLERFNQRLEEGQANYTGIFLDGPHWKSYQSSLMLNSVYQQGMCALDCFGNPEQASYIGNQLIESGSGQAGRIGKYLVTVTLAEKDKATVDEVIQAIDGVKVLGATPVFRLFDEIKDNFTFGSAEAADIVSNMVSSIDSRVDGRYDYAKAMGDYLLNIGTAERVYQTIIDDSPTNSGKLRAWRGFYFRDLEVVETLLEDPRLSYAVTRYIADRFASEELSDSGLERVYLKILSRYPGSLGIRMTYFEALEDRGYYQAGRETMLEWHTKYSKRAYPTERFRALTYIGRSYRMEGKLEKAREAIQPTLDGSYGYGYYESTRIALAEGQVEEAMRIAEEVRGRYPASRYSLQNSLRAYWVAGEYAKAARLIGNAPRYSHGFWRQDLGRIFTQSFEANSSAGTAAIRALVDEGLASIKILELVFAANSKGLNELAFNASQELRYEGQGGFVYKLHAYRALKEWKGKKEALAWLKSQYSEGKRNSLSTIVYYYQEHDLLWDFITNPEKGSHPYGVWYIRAAAQAMGSQKDEARNRQLLNYYDNPEHNSFYDDLGRLALGLESDETLLNTPYSAKRLGEVSYYKGVYEYSQGRYQEAADWFRTTVETRATTNGEYRWAYGSLYTWISKDTELRRQIEASL